MAYCKLTADVGILKHPPFLRYICRAIGIGRRHKSMCAKPPFLIGLGLEKEV